MRFYRALRGCSCGSRGFRRGPNDGHNHRQGATSSTSRVTSPQVDVWKCGIGWEREEKWHTYLGGVYLRGEGHGARIGDRQGMGEGERVSPPGTAFSTHTAGCADAKQCMGEREGERGRGRGDLWIESVMFQPRKSWCSRYSASRQVCAFVGAGVRGGGRS